MDMLEKRIVTWKDVRSIKDADSFTAKESMVSLNDLFQTRPRPEMQEYTGSEIFVRQNVAERLIMASGQLRLLSMFLLVVYGYRHPRVQESRFYEMLEKLRRDEENAGMSEEDLYSLTHNFIAVPEVAGHLTGGAVDLTLVNAEGQELDMGTKISDFRDPEKITTFSTQLTELQRKNRLYLRMAMMESGFVPFNGEWWHFSHGDKEWAFWEKRQNAKYNPVLFRTQKEKA
ncbi:MAG: M15 family metallopeptidase [Minisyncoccia bacterium]